MMSRKCSSFKAFQLLGIGEEYAKIADEVPSWFRYLNWSDGAEITHVRQFEHI
jgi:hypothetical protein